MQEKVSLWGLGISNLEGPPCRISNLKDPHRGTFPYIKQQYFFLAFLKQLIIRLNLPEDPVKCRQVSKWIWGKSKKVNYDKFRLESDLKILPKQKKQKCQWFTVRKVATRSRVRSEYMRNLLSLITPTSTNTSNCWFLGVVGFARCDVMGSNHLYLGRIRNCDICGRCAPYQVVPEELENWCSGTLNTICTCSTIVFFRGEFSPLGHTKRGGESNKGNFANCF